jgi:hypothetical protein
MTVLCKIQIISCLISCFSFLSCNGSKLEPTEDYIRIGNGGGFAGKETVYTVYRNGHVEEAGKKIGRLKNEDTEQVFNNIKALSLDNIFRNKPGNLYSFIEYSMRGAVHKITWDSNAEDVENNLHLFYDHVLFLIKKSI